MKSSIVKLSVFIFIILTAFVRYPIFDHKTLEIGANAPDFNLKSVDGKFYSLASFKKADVLVIVFTCNHCPTAQAYEDRLIKLTSDYAKKNVAVVAIMPNDPSCLRLDELDFSDIGDSYEEMKIRAMEKKFNFPYLYDGETEKVSMAYGPVATPHVFVFDKERKLCYQGRVDDMESPFKTPTSPDARNAINAILNNQEVVVKTTKVFGCSVKWSEKKDLVEKVRREWAKEPVHLESIGVDSLKNMISNPSDKLRLINFWATQSPPSEKEFQEFVSINRMYRDRDFEFISISTDAPGNKDTVLKFLQVQQASNSNYIFNKDDKQIPMNAIVPSWQGNLPYTILVEPGGAIVYAKAGPIDPARLKWTIVNNHLIGKYP
jgi:thiol-disulfide isomerase/thioredoxin